jgi:hypothetical protein
MVQFRIRIELENLHLSVFPIHGKYEACPASENIADLRRTDNIEPERWSTGVLE